MSFEGTIGEIDLVQRLVELGREKFTGAIRFEQEGIIKIVYFKGGDVLSASTNDRSDAVDEILLRAGKVSKEHVKQALGSRKENETLGDALLNLGFITRKELTWGRRIQVIGILRSVRGWTVGSYAIVADYLPKREEGTLFPLTQILIELFVTEHERQPFERALDGGAAVLTKNENFDAEFQRLGLNEEAAEIASKIDGTRSAAEIAGIAGKDVFNTYKLLEGLRALGLLQKAQAKDEPQVKDELGFESVGVADAADAWNSGRVPAFQTEPEPPAQPMPAPVAADAIPPPAVADLKFGFDEPPIEPARRESAPPPPSPPPSPRKTLSSTQTRRVAPKFTRAQPKKSSRVPVFSLIFVLLFAAAGFAAWYWWTSRSAAPPPPAPVAQTINHPVIVPTPVAPPPPPGPTESAPPTASSGGRPPSAVRVAAGAPTVRAASGAPAATRAQRPPSQDKYATMAAEFARNPKGNFTLQFELVCQTSSLAKALEGGGANIWFVPISYRGQACYRVFWGHYDTREAADAATSQIPASLHGGKPVVVTVPKP